MTKQRKRATARGKTDALTGDRSTTPSDTPPSGALLQELETILMQGMPCLYVASDTYLGTVILCWSRGGVFLR